MEPVGEFSKDLYHIHQCKICLLLADDPLVCKNIVNNKECSASVCKSCNTKWGNQHRGQFRCTSCRSTIGFRFLNRTEIIDKNKMMFTCKKSNC